MDDKHSTSDISDEKKGLDGVEVTEDAIMAKEVEEFEERLQKDEATEGEYLVQEAYEVAIKVCLPPSSYLDRGSKSVSKGPVYPRRP